MKTLSTASNSIGLFLCIALLNGETAEGQLEETRQFETLSSAINAAQYGMRKADGSGVWMQNPVQGLKAVINEEGLRLRVGTIEEKSYFSQWRLAGVGRGEKWRAVPVGMLVHDGQRAEIEREEVGITEWFVNRPSGLEHGFTLTRRPAGDSEAFVLKLSVSGDLEATVSDNGQKVILCERKSGERVLDYDKLKVWDADGKVLSARMRGSEDRGTLFYEVVDRGARYPLTIDPTISQQAYFKASNPGEGDHFGSSVSVSGDTVVVGAPREDGSGTGINPTDNDSAFDAGAVYVFVRSGGMWSQQAHLKGSNTGAGDLFGLSVSVSGDTLAVGTLFEDGSGTGINPPSDDSADGAGAAYVFVRNAGVWSQQAYLKASNAEADDSFGSSISLSGDTLVVGAEFEGGSGTGVNPPVDNLGGSPGAAYVFVRNGGVWSQQAYLKASNTDGGDRFGCSVTVWGDTIVVGAPREDGSGTGVNPADNDSATAAGAAYVYVRSGGVWSHQAYLKASNAGQFDQFGWAVSGYGDTVVVSADEEDGSGTGINPADNNSANTAGAVYVFIRNGGVWSQQAYLKAFNAGRSDRFGGSIAVFGDTLMVGAPGEGGGGTGIDPPDNVFASLAGAAYFFTRSSGVWSQQAYLKGSNTEASDQLGAAVAVSADIALVGATGEDGSGTGVDPLPNNLASSSGAIYVFTLPTVTPPLSDQKPELSIASNGDVTVTLSSVDPAKSYVLQRSIELKVWANISPFLTGSTSLSADDINPSSDFDAAYYRFAEVEP